jgi:hypothetical protein
MRRSSCWRVAHSARRTSCCATWRTTSSGRFYINPHYFVWADFGREIDNVTGIPCAYVVHGFRHVRRDERGDYAGGGYIMLTNHQSPGIAAVMLGGTGRDTRTGCGGTGIWAP